MKSMSGFTKRKFLALTPSQQHKKASEMVRASYETLSVSEYQTMRAWLGMEPVEVSKEALSNAYHEHIRKAGQGLKEHHLLPRVRRGDREEKGDSLPYSLYLDQIRSAHNVGSILRSAEAFNIERVYFSKDTPLPTHPQVQKTSMGAWEWVTWEVCDALPRPLIALETCEGAEKLGEFVFPAGCVIAIGNEEFGCSESVLKSAEAIVEIPLLGKKNSLNVANVCAIVLYELKRAWEDGKPDSVAGNHSSRRSVARTLKRS